MTTTISKALAVERASGDSCIVTWGGHPLCDYTAVPQTPRRESPKPYFHPVRTLGGVAVTDFQPSDHPWHHGIAFAPTYVGDDTFWGGPTFVGPTEGYVWQDNHGRQEHLGWVFAEAAADRVTWNQQLAWRGHDERVCLCEERAITISVPRPKAGWWCLAGIFALHNVAGRPLSLASPVSRGCAGCGYFGLMWRGAPALAHGNVFTAERNGLLVIGTRAPWLAYASPSARASLLFIDDLRNPRYPTAWFARSGDQPVVSLSTAYDEPIVIPDGATLILRHRIIIVDGVLTRPEAERLVHEQSRDDDRAAGTGPDRSHE